jgi:cell division transport system permease protein
MTYVLYALRECKWGLVRGARSYAVSVVTTAAVLLAVGLILLGSRSLDALIARVREQAQITLYLKQGQDPAVIEAALRSLPGVTGVRLVTKDEALAQLRRDLGQDAFLLEALEGVNPLADSLEVAVVPERASDVAGAAASLAGVERVRDNRDLLARLVRVTRFVRVGGAAFSTTLLGTSLMAAANTARLTVYARRSEIEIRILLGAPGWFVKAPFLLEGVASGALAALLAGIGLAALYPVLQRYATAALPFAPVLAPAGVLPSIVGALLLAGTLSALAGGWVGATFRR